MSRKWFGCILVVACVSLAGCGDDGRDPGPLDQITADGRVILGSDRIAGDDPGTSQLIVNWGRKDPTYNDRVYTEGLTLFDEGRDGRSYRKTYTLDPPSGGKPEQVPLHHWGYDLDGDGHAEVLIIEYIGGSAGARIFHLLGRSHGRTRELYREDVSYDDGVVLFDDDRLVTYKGVVQAPGDNGIHCCWIRYARTVREFRGGDLVVTSRSRVSKLPAADRDYVSRIGGSKGPVR